ncbi:1-acyl-sn-glycerol-3-phosphate acyltransferase [Actinomadura sp. ATCC 31491]|uniref:1-acyl-sn-glycerol-3-phosphate acyltransferase n=1 Tax=Actinomadura luzonensis TaxID=2805427 RepID=A0ABT0FIU6_9ACTN|nr:1-acyl-sn-glycerol-3-phosphate acyltransferase [Actinomadura luzonensis]MCK2212219.1 1-acyl-sn-glycerol-3-phosphate acyltransferase [Actinomadura luzonensis]
MLPPRILRRLVLAPLVIVVTVAMLVTLPLWLVVTAAASMRLPPPQRRGPRFVWFGVAWLTLESLVLIACLWLWVAGGARHQERHYGLVTWFLSRVYGAAVRIFRLRLDVEEPAGRGGVSSRPVIVLARHAGPGDSFLLIHRLLVTHGRRPRIVMKAVLQYDPTLDVVINRLPNAFVPRRSGHPRTIGEIRRLAATMDERDALVIFPEGANFSPRRRRVAIRRLEAKGLAEEAERARGLEHVLPPRPNGALAAISACPAADVVFVAHTGLDDLVTLGDIWRRLPYTAHISAKWWLVPAAEVPRGRAERVRWLYDNWARIDAWISEQRLPVGGAGPPAGRC